MLYFTVSRTNNKNVNPCAALKDSEQRHVGITVGRRGEDLDFRSDCKEERKGE